MKRIITMSLILLLTGLLLPLCYVQRTGSAPLPQDTPLPAEEPVAGGQDAAVVLYVAEGDTVRQRTMADYLPGVLAGEMPAAFEPEALKAQAVAARTYILYCKARGNPRHPEADVCNDPGCCKAYADEAGLRENWGENYEANLARITGAVRETDGLYLCYDGEPIQAVFHSSSAGKTESSENLWGAQPYLVSVESPETESMVPSYVSTVEMTADEFRTALTAAAPEAVLGDDPARWITDVQYNESGRVQCFSAGGVDLSGHGARSAFGLRSTAFTVRCSGQTFKFTVTGYGHGVGLSQYGANAMARDGADFQEILLHYYVGAELTDGQTGAETETRS